MGCAANKYVYTSLFAYTTTTTRRPHGSGSLAVRGTGSGGRRQLQNVTLGLPPDLTRTAPNRISRERFLGFWATDRHDECQGSLQTADTVPWPAEGRWGGVTQPPGDSSTTTHRDNNEKRGNRKGLRHTPGASHPRHHPHAAPMLRRKWLSSTVGAGGH